MEPIKKQPEKAGRRRKVLGGLGLISVVLAGFLVLSAAAAGACTTSGQTDNGHAVLSGQYSGPVVTGTISSIVPTYLTITTGNGTSWTVDISPATTVREGGQTIAASALVVGERVAVKGSITANDTINASSIWVVLAQLRGTVVSVSAGSFTISDALGFWRVVVEEPTTIYVTVPPFPGAPATVSDVVTGAHVWVSGLVDPNHTSLDATIVRILTVPASDNVIPQPHPDLFVRSAPLGSNHATHLVLSYFRHGHHGWGRWGH